MPHVKPCHCRYSVSSRDSADSISPATVLPYTSCVHKGMRPCGAWVVSPGDARRVGEAQQAVEAWRAGGPWRAGGGWRVAAAWHAERARRRRSLPRKQGGRHHREILHHRLHPVAPPLQHSARLHAAVSDTSPLPSAQAPAERRPPGGTTHLHRVHEAKLAKHVFVEAARHQVAAPKDELPLTVAAAVRCQGRDAAAVKRRRCRPPTTHKAVVRKASHRCRLPATSQLLSLRCLACQQPGWG